MNEVITKLNEIEEKADAILLDAKSRKEQMMERLEADKREIDEKYARMEAETVREFEAQLKAYGKAQVEALREQSRAELEQLDRTFEEQKVHLAEELLKQILQ